MKQIEKEKTNFATLKNWQKKKKFIWISSTSF